MTLHLATHAESALGLQRRELNSFEKQILEAYDGRCVVKLYCAVDAWATVTAREHGLSAVKLRIEAQCAACDALKGKVSPIAVCDAVAETLHREIQKKTTSH